MNLPPDRSADAFSDWLEARVAGKSTPGHELAADPELGALCAAAGQFHGLSERWAQQEAMVSSPRVTTWEDLMTSSSHALPRRSSIVVPNAHMRELSGRWETWNRFASGFLVAAMLIAIGAGAWRVAGDRQSGPGTEPPTTTGVFGLQPTGDSAVATPDQTGEPERSAPAITPVDELPGIESAISRAYSPQSDRPPAIPDLTDITVSVSRFDSSDNARASYDLLVSNVIGDLAGVQPNDPGYTLASANLIGPGERSNLVRLDVTVTGSQSHEFLLTLHEAYVFTVMTITSGPYAAAATPGAAAEPSATALDLATALVTNAQPSPKEARFFEDGTSIGGDWGFLPTAGDPLLAGWLPKFDAQEFPTDPNDSAADTSFPPDAPDLTGIEAAVSREYTPADMFIGSASFDNATPMTEADLAAIRYSGITILIYQLDDAKDAAVAYDRLSRGLFDTLPDLNGGDGDERLVSEDLTGIGDRATRSHLTITLTDQGSIRQRTFQYLTVQRGEFVFVISSQSSLGPVETLPAPSDAPDPMLDLAVQIVSEGEISPDAPVVAEDGTSTGGLWGFMPAESDSLLMGLAPWMDHVLYPVQEP